MTESSHVLVTGGTGCIGTQTVKWLLANTRATVVVGSREVSRQQTRDLFEEDDCTRLKSIRIDIRNQRQLEEALTSHAITHVIHLAAMQTPDCNADRDLGLQVNLAGTQNLIEAIKACRPSLHRPSGGLRQPSQGEIDPTPGHLVLQGIACLEAYMRGPLEARLSLNQCLPRLWPAGADLIAGEGARASRALSSLSAGLLRQDADFLGDLGPALVLAGKEGANLIGGKTRFGERAGGVDLGCRVAVTGSGVEFAVHPLNHGFGRSRGGDQCKPAAHVKAREAFCQRRNLLPTGHARGCSHREHAQPALAHQLCGRGDVGNHGVDMSANRILNGHAHGCVGGQIEFGLGAGIEKARDHAAEGARSFISQ